MRVTITARHCDVSDELRARARAIVERLGRVAMRPHDVRVLFALEHGQPVVELRLHTVRGRVHVGRAPAQDHRTALDRAAGRLRRQLIDVPARRRARERVPR
jgi:ribosome-associated translation inhibitor RaiA